MVWQGPSWVASGNEGSRKLCYGLSCNLGGAWRHGTPPPLVDTLLREGHIDTVAAGLASKLSTVRWLKSDAWVGIAIKVTPTGYSFAGGAKDSGSALQSRRQRPRIRASPGYPIKRKYCKFKATKESLRANRQFRPASVCRLVSADLGTSWPGQKLPTGDGPG